MLKQDVQSLRHFGCHLGHVTQLLLSVSYNGGPILSLALIGQVYDGSRGHSAKTRCSKSLTFWLSSLSCDPVTLKRFI